jgi:DNA-binding PadR family transcriptional regulator
MDLIGRNGAGPHDLVQMARRGQRLYWAGAESKIYEQPKRLERLGYLVSEKTPGKTRERTHYRLTEKGIAALREWLGRPTHFPRIQSEAAIRIQTSDLADDPSVILESFNSLRTEIEELSDILDEAERREPQFPHRRANSDSCTPSADEFSRPTSTGSTKWIKNSPARSERYARDPLRCSAHLDCNRRR